MLSQRTIELLTDIKYNILACPETFRMEYAFQYAEDSPCNTAACIAGHACTLKVAGKSLDTAEQLFQFPRNPIAYAAEYLSLDRAESRRLFFLSRHTGFKNERWPTSFERRYLAAKTAKGRAKVAAERIDHFIKTGGRE